MAPPLPIENLVRQVGRQVRLRRAERAGVRGAFWGAAAAVLVLVFKGPLGPLAPGLAAGLVAAGALGGVAWGLARRVGAGDAARVADRAFALDDRVATVLERAGRPDRAPGPAAGGPGRPAGPPLGAARAADTLARVRALEPRRVVARVPPREARW